MLTAEERSGTVELRHSQGPTVTYLVMGAAFQLVMWIPYSKHGDPTSLYLGAIFWLYVIYKIASFHLYRVRFDEFGVSKRPFGTFRWQTIPFKDISRVEIRRLKPTLRGKDGQLPTSRLELQSRSREPFAVSLTHFKMTDIQALLDRLGRERPELTLPRLSRSFNK